MGWLAKLAAVALPALNGAAYLAYAGGWQGLPEDASRWLIGLHFAQLPLALILLVYAESMDEGLSFRLRLALFAICLGILGLAGLMFAPGILLDPVVAGAIGWSVAGHAVALLTSPRSDAAAALRARTISRDAWELWVVVTVTGAAAAIVVALFVADARREWAGLVGATYWALMVAALLNVNRERFVRDPRGLSERGIFRVFWALFGQKADQRSS